MLTLSIYHTGRNLDCKLLFFSGRNCHVEESTQGCLVLVSAIRLRQVRTALVIVSHLTYPLTMRVVGTPQITSQLLHFSLFSTALWDLVNSWPILSLMLSSHLFFCLPCLLSPFTLPCKMILARPDERETCPYHFNLCFFTMV